MGKRWRVWALAAAVLLPGAARAAESLVNGERLRFDHEYVCKGERFFIVRCTGDDDGADCGVGYPDRPRVRGLVVAVLERRGDIVARLNACAAPARPAAGLAQAGAAPGLGRAAWKTLGSSRIGGIFFNPAGIRRTPAGAQGWITDLFKSPAQLNGVTGIGALQTLYEADCGRNVLNWRRRAYFGQDGRLLREEPLATAPLQTPPGSINEDYLKILCGRPVHLADPTPVTTDFSGLKAKYAAMSAALGRSGASAAPAASAGLRPPGLGEAERKVLYLNPRSAAFFTPATLTRGPPTGRAWFTEVFAKPITLGELTGVGVTQSLDIADCTRGAITTSYLAAYSPEGRLLFSEANPQPTGARPGPGTTRELQFKLLCARPLELYSDELIPMDLQRMQDIYFFLLKR